MFDWFRKVKNEALRVIGEGAEVVETRSESECLSRCVGTPQVGTNHVFPVPTRACVCVCACVCVFVCVCVCVYLSVCV